MQDLTKPASDVEQFKKFAMAMKSQMSLALPKHLNADRMARLAITAFSTTPGLAKCSLNSIASGIMTAAQLGLEIGVGGQGWLIPYKGTASFVPGWKGLVDLVNRSGRSSVWTGAVMPGDIFSYSRGTRPEIHHDDSDGSPGGEFTHVYAVGWVKDSQWPIIEVWSRRKVQLHLDQYDKVTNDQYGKKHYARANENNFQMYGRKVVLLQVLKYLPQSIELNAAIEVSHAAEEGKSATIDGSFFVISDDSENATSPQNNGGLEIKEPIAKSKSTTHKDKTPLPEGIVKAFKARLEKAGIMEQELFKAFNLSGWDSFYAEDNATINAWISNPNV